MGSQTRRTSERFVCSTGRLTSARFFVKKLSAISCQPVLVSLKADS